MYCKNKETQKRKYFAKKESKKLKDLHFRRKQSPPGRLRNKKEISSCFVENKVSGIEQITQGYKSKVYQANFFGNEEVFRSRHTGKKTETTEYAEIECKKFSKT